MKVSKGQSLVFDCDSIANQETLVSGRNPLGKTLARAPFCGVCSGSLGWHVDIGPSGYVLHPCFNRLASRKHFAPTSSFKIECHLNVLQASHL